MYTERRKATDSLTLMRLGVMPSDAATIAEMGDGVASLRDMADIMLGLDFSPPTLKHDARVGWWYAEHIPMDQKRLLDPVLGFEPEDEQTWEGRLVAEPIAAVWNPETERFTKYSPNQPRWPAGTEEGEAGPGSGGGRFAPKDGPAAKPARANEEENARLVHETWDPNARGYIQMLKDVEAGKADIFDVLQYFQNPEAEAAVVGYSVLGKERPAALYETHGIKSGEDVIDVLREMIKIEPELKHKTENRLSEDLIGRAAGKVTNEFVDFSLKKLGEDEGAGNITLEHLQEIMTISGMRPEEIHWQAWREAARGRSLTDVYLSVAVGEPNRHTSIKIRLGGGIWDSVVSDEVGVLMSDAEMRQAIWESNPWNAESLPPRLRDALGRFDKETFDPQTGDSKPYDPEKVAYFADSSYKPGTKERWGNSPDSQFADNKAKAEHIAAAAGMPADQIARHFMSWGRTSNHSREAVIFQKAAADELDASLSTWQEEQFEKEYADSSPGMWNDEVWHGTLSETDDKTLYQESRRLARAIYDDTQKTLKEAGITELRVFRGTRSKQAPPLAPGDVAKIEQNGLSSWSLSYREAILFASRDNASYSLEGNDYGIGWTTTVPAEDVFSLGSVSMGNPIEAEAIVIGRGKPIKARLEYAHNFIGADVKRRADELANLYQERALSHKSWSMGNR